LALNLPRDKTRMSLNIIEHDDGKILEMEMSGKLVDSDFRLLEPTFSRLVKKHGKIRVLLRMLDFHGWEGAAFWDEVKFDLKHFGEIERLAMVGDKKWEKFLSDFSRPFTSATIRYFDKDSAPEARVWLASNAA